MRIFLAILTGVTVAASLAGASLVGCSSNSESPTASLRPAIRTTTSPFAPPASTPTQPTDFTRLAIQARDLSAPETFTTSPPIRNPDGQAGVLTTFSNHDRTQVITDSILILSDPAAAMDALNSTKASLDGFVHGVPAPIEIGTGGTTVSGPSPDGSKGVTVLLFTEGKAFVELEFDGPPDSLVPPDFVADTGQKQDRAIKNGLR